MSRHIKSISKLQGRRYQRQEQRRLECHEPRRRLGQQQDHRDSRGTRCGRRFPGWGCPLRGRASECRHCFFPPAGVSVDAPADNSRGLSPLWVAASSNSPLGIQTLAELGKRTYVPSVGRQWRVGVQAANLDIQLTITTFHYNIFKNEYRRMHRCCSGTNLDRVRSAFFGENFLRDLRFFTKSKAIFTVRVSRNLTKSSPIPCFLNRSSTVPQMNAQARTRTAPRRKACAPSTPPPPRAMTRPSPPSCGSARASTWSRPTREINILKNYAVDL